MPLIRTDTIPGEPIIINVFQGRVGLIDVQKAEVANLQYIEKYGHLYSIGDLRDISTAFPDVLAVIHHDSQGKPGSALDPNMTLILVATSEFIKLFVNAMKQAGGAEIPTFTDLDEAIQWARADHAKK